MFKSHSNNLILNNIKQKNIFNKKNINKLSNDFQNLISKIIN